MASSERQVARALDPMAEDSPVSRFLKSLQERLKNAEQNQAEQLNQALKAIDANDETSLINRLAKETRDAKTSLLKAINTQDPHSPLGSMKTALEGMLEKEGLSAKEFREKQEQRQHELELLIKEALARFETKKQHDSNSAHGGATFEDAVVAFVAGAASGNSYVVEATGGVAGNIPRNKVGDVLVHFTQESAFAGCKVVVEAKHDRSYTVAKSLEELETAKRNRNASVGLFVMSASHASTGFPEFARYGSNILVTWDQENGLTDYRFRAALTAALCLATRKVKMADEGDIKALERVRIDIEGQLDRLGKIRKSNDNIRSNVDRIEKEIQSSEKDLKKLIENAEKTLRALNVELVNEAEEVETPIRLSSMPPAGW